MSQSGHIAQLPGILHNLEPVLNHYGYLAIAGFVFLEDFGVPLPGETILILGAIYAGAGKLNIVAVGVIALAAAIAGDNVGYAIGHFGGRPLIARFGRYVLLTPEKLEKATSFFERHGGKVVVIARFVEGLRQANGIIAGISSMRWLRFLFFNVAGAALWVAVWTTIGYTAGSHIDEIYKAAIRYEVYLGVAVGVLILAYIGWRVWGRRRRSKASSASDTGGSGGSAR